MSALSLTKARGAQCDDDLSAVERAALPGYCPAWTLETVRTDCAAVEEDVRALYAAASLSQPRSFAWSADPIAMTRDWVKSVKTGVAGNSVKSTVFESPLAAVEERARQPVSSEVWAQILAFGGSPALTSFETTRASILEAMIVGFDTIPFAWWRRLLHPRDQPAMVHIDRAWSPVNEHAARLAAVRFLDEMRPTHERHSAGLAELLRLAQSGCWLVAHDTTCWISHGPTRLAVGADARLHSANGPALAFSDGWCGYAWKGVQVPAWMIEKPQQISVTLIADEPRTLVKRAMIDIMTPQRFIAEGGAACVSVDETGKLWRRLWWDYSTGFVDDWAAVEVVNPTPESDGTYKHYFLQVPSTMRSPREAVAWTYGMSEHAYSDLIVRT